MTEHMTAAPVEPPPEAQLMKLTSGCLVVPAKLGIPDLLKSGPMTAAEIAKATASGPDAL